MFRKIVKLFCLAGVALSLCGCDVFMEAMDAENAKTADDPTSDNYQARFVVGVFAIVDYPRASRLERELVTASGEKIWINRNQYFGSNHIKEAKVVARPGNPDICDLKIKMDRPGRTQWEILAGNHRGQEVVLVVDGRHMANFIPAEPDENNRNWVTLRVGIDPYTAKGVAKYAKKNYTFYNPDSASFFNKL
jgi:hypothetical protein